ncbi:MAG: helicase-associated domain-containing protein [Bacillota bacterium]
MSKGERKSENPKAQKGGQTRPAAEDPRVPGTDELFASWVALAVGGDRDWSVTSNQALQRIKGELQILGVHRAPVSVVHQLKQKGWLLEHAAGKPGVLWVPPEHRATALGRLARIGEHIAKEALDRNPAMLPPDDQWAQRILELDQDLVILLAEHRLRPVRLTRQGEYYKRDRERLESLLSPATAGETGRILSYLHREHLIYHSNYEVRVGPLVEKWLELPRVQRWTGMYNQWALQVGAWNPFPWYRRFLYLLSLTTAGRWCDLGALISFLGHFTDRQDLFGYLLPYTRLLTLLGVIDQVQLPLVAPDKERDPGTLRPGDGGPVFRLLARVSPAGRRAFLGETPELPGESTGFVVQPNLEVVAPGDLQPRLLWRLQTAAELQSRDRALVYSLTRESIERALGLGVDGRELVGFLQAHAQYPVTDNVLATIEGWVTAFNRMFMMEATILWCDSEATARLLRDSPGLGPYCLGSITGRDLVIDGARVREVMAILRESGHRLRSEVVRWDGCAPRQPEEDYRKPVSAADWAESRAVVALTRALEDQELAPAPARASSTPATGSRQGSLDVGRNAGPVVDRQLRETVDAALIQSRWVTLIERGSDQRLVVYPLAQRGLELAAYYPLEDGVIILDLEHYEWAVLGHQDRRTRFTKRFRLPPGFY